VSVSLPTRPPGWLLIEFNKSFCCFSRSSFINFHEFHFISPHFTVIVKNNFINFHFTSTVENMFRPIRMDHTNCLQVAIKSIQFNLTFHFISIHLKLETLHFISFQLTNFSNEMQPLPLFVSFRSSACANRSWNLPLPPRGFFFYSQI
jgi:hypothetical protein